MANKQAEQKAAEQKEKFVIFRRTSLDAGYFSFNGYSIDGVNQFLFRGTDPYDPTGQKQAKYRVTFEPNMRDLLVSKRDPELIEFLKNNPECLNGPNGDGKNGLYFLYDEDAEINAANEKRQKKITASNVANSLKGDELKNVAAIYGYFGPNQGKLKSTVLSAAEKDPDEFLTTAGGGELTAAKALFLKAEDAEAIKVDGVAYVFGQQHLGSSPEEAISTMLSDKNIMNAIKKAVGIKVEEVGNIPNPDPAVIDENPDAGGSVIAPPVVPPASTKPNPTKPGPPPAK